MGNTRLSSTAPGKKHMPSWASYLTFSRSPETPFPCDIWGPLGDVSFCRRPGTRNYFVCRSQLLPPAKLFRQPVVAAVVMIHIPMAPSVYTLCILWGLKSADRSCVALQGICEPNVETGWATILCPERQGIYVGVCAPKPWMRMGT